MMELLGINRPWAVTDNRSLTWHVFLRTLSERRERILLSQHLIRTFFLAMVLVGTSGQSAPQNDSEEQENYLTQSSAWQIVLSTHELKNYLSYKGSSLAPLTEVNVGYRFRDPENWKWVPMRNYETLWFSNGRPVGCRRFERLAIKPEMEGNILIEKSSEALEHMDPIADTVVRLFLDLQLNKVEFDGVVLPDDQFDAIASSLGRFSFYPKHLIVGESGVLLRVVTTSREKERYFYFRSD